MFGIMARPACRRISVRDPLKLLDPLHVISYPVVVGAREHLHRVEMEVFEASLVDTLRTDFGITLACATNGCMLSTSQVNVPVVAMSEALCTLGACLCRVSLFGMRISIPSAEPVIDNFIRRYRDQMGATVPTGRNVFDYGARYPTDVVQLFRFSEELATPST